jgi:hypothetical protein
VFVTQYHFVEGSGSRPGSLGVHETGGPPGEMRVEGGSGTVQRGNDGKRDKNRHVFLPLTVLRSALSQDPGALFWSFKH